MTQLFDCKIKRKYAAYKANLHHKDLACDRLQFLMDYYELRQRDFTNRDEHYFAKGSVSDYCNGKATITLQAAEGFLAIIKSTLIEAPIKWYTKVFLEGDEDPEVPEWYAKIILEVSYELQLRPEWLCCQDDIMLEIDKYESELDSNGQIHFLGSPSPVIQALNLLLSGTGYRIEDNLSSLITKIDSAEKDRRKSLTLKESLEYKAQEGELFREQFEGYRETFEKPYSLIKDGETVATFTHDYFCRLKKDSGKFLALLLETAFSTIEINHDTKTDNNYDNN